MCALKRLYFVVLISLLLHSCANGKKSKKIKRPTVDDEETTPQPNVVTYSSFGFNDVGNAYDGFVPSSPDYANYLSNSNQESSTRLYAPAFPTAMDHSPYGQQEAGFPGSAPDNREHGMLQYNPGTYNFGNSPNYGSSHLDMPSQVGREDNGDGNEDEYNSPVYGTKLGSKGNKMRPGNNYNSSIVYGSSPYNPVEEKPSYHEMQAAEEQNKHQSQQGESGASSYNYFNNYAPIFPSSGNSNNGEDTKQNSNPGPNSVKYNKVVDFTKYKPSYPLELDNKYATGTVRPSNMNMNNMNMYNSMTNGQNDNSFSNQYYPSDNENQHTQKYKQEQYEPDEPEQVATKPIGTNYMEFSVNHVQNPNNYKEAKPNAEYKDKFKTKPWNNYNAEVNNYKNSFKNNEYNDTKSNFRRPFRANNDEVPAASNTNVVDFTNYRYPETDFSNFKNMNDYKSEGSENYPSVQSFKYQDVQGESDYYNQLKGLFTTTPSSTSHWGSMFKNGDRQRPKKPQSTDDEVVHIPKRLKLHKQQTGKHSEYQSPLKHGLYKGKPLDEWNKEVSNRFKNEEDLLGLRNHDTSHPQYLPNFKQAFADAEDQFKNYMSEAEYKKLVDKWRQSYMRSKYGPNKDTEAYGSETRPMHVPIPKPYPIEVPHPVIVPVPQPYPVRVPVPKPVAVPVIREITVPIEKPVPYPVIKKVPYPVEKPVPVHVEKEVQVPVMKPYAVPVPHVRPVFHHSRPYDEVEGERELDHEELDYMPRPEASRGKKYIRSSYKKTRSNRNRSRRPSSSYYNRRRMPVRRSTPAPARAEPPRPRRRPPPAWGTPRHRYAPSHDYDDDRELDHEHPHNEYYEH
ncbi:uncharacterized protein DDB_G0283357 [Plutella xylostella]|uniref:uncharacterized protein DDB_G0283357 n=1 Tax=Plutella xylostella TaxID=51655 RepID=UPI002032BBED|nr:uncharacterized protein DDB_G0283357 [Plutella xylostella]